MLKAWRGGIGLLALAWATWAGAQPPAPSATARPVVRVAVVGGLLQSGVWPRLADKAAVGAGLRVDTVAAAPKEGMFRAIPPVEVAKAVWEAYHADKLHWYVPPELIELDKAATLTPEAVRDQMAQGGLFSAPP